VGWGGGLVVVAGVTTRRGGREIRPQGEGGQQVEQQGGWKVGRQPVRGESLVNTDDPELAVGEEERRVLRIQAKLHRWARDDRAPSKPREQYYSRRIRKHLGS
jgi:hypothetical protein